MPGVAGAWGQAEGVRCVPECRDQLVELGIVLREAVANTALVLGEGGC